MNLIDRILIKDPKKIVDLISMYYPFNIDELSDFEDKLNFYDGISQNKNILFDESILNKFSKKLNFKILQYYNIDWDENLLRKYSSKWDWDYFYKDVSFDWNFELIWEFKNRIGIKSFNDYIEKLLVDKTSLLEFYKSLTKISGNGLKSTDVTNEFVKKISTNIIEHSITSKFKRDNNYIIAERIDINKHKLIPGILMTFILKFNKNHEQIKNILEGKDNDYQSSYSEIDLFKPLVRKVDKKLVFESEEELINYIIALDKIEIPWQNFVLSDKFKWTDKFFINCGEKLNVNESLWIFINQIKVINSNELKLIMCKVDKYENQNSNLPF